MGHYQTHLSNQAQVAHWSHDLLARGYLGLDVDEHSPALFGVAQRSNFSEVQRDLEREPPHGDPSQAQDDKLKNANSAGAILADTHTARDPSQARDNSTATSAPFFILAKESPPFT